MLRIDASVLDYAIIGIYFVVVLGSCSRARPTRRRPPA
jgi:hypothetical protein